ncbi:MAG: sulfatase, partial [Paenibacillus sp.]|nr:sulfatase [Paenibacillus sp.]
HKVYAHYGIRTEQYKLIYYYADALDTNGTEDDPKPPEWELFDLKKDPYEMLNVYDDPDYARIVELLTDRLHELQAEVRDVRYEPA